VLTSTPRCARPRTCATVVSMTGEPLEALRQANRLAGEFLARLRDSALGRTEAVTALGGLEVLGEALTRVRPLVASQPVTEWGPAARSELAQYVENLRRLREVLEALQEDLTGRRSELAARLQRAQAMLEWARSVQQTLGSG
jgi:hypothetical protein